MPETSAILEPLPWETRNLGVEAFRVNADFLRKPDGAALGNALDDLRSLQRRYFVQARFEPNTRTSRLLQANDFYFVETTLSPHVVLAKCEPLQRFGAHPSELLPRRYSLSDLEVVVAATPELTAAVKRIAGEAFTHDRFHVDHNCDPATANRRYLYWIDDLFRDPQVRFHALLFRLEAIAFMASRGGDLRLAGFARRYANAGLGEYFWLRVLQMLQHEGVDTAQTLISATNVAVVNLYARLAFKFRDPRATFHLWADAHLR